MNYKAQEFLLSIIIMFYILPIRESQTSPIESKVGAEIPIKK